jgi:hypothetical protein
MGGRDHSCPGLDRARPRSSRIRAYKAIPALDDRIVRVVYWHDVVLTAYPDRDALKRKTLP